MNLPPESRSRPHNLLLVALTEGKPRDFPKILNRFNELQDFMVGDRAWRPIICFVSADLPALADCAGVQGHCALFGCVRCYMAATRMGPRLCYVGHNRFFLEGDARHNDSLVRPRELPCTCTSRPFHPDPEPGNLVHFTPTPCDTTSVIPRLCV